MRKFSRLIALAASGALGLTGCSNPFGHPSGIANGSQASFDQMAADQQRRSIVAPAVGLDNSVEPTATQKLGASVAAVPAKIGSSISSGAKKATSWMVPSSTATASTAVSTDSSWFGKKKDVSPELHVATAHVYEKNGNYADAAAEYEKALKESPNNVPALLSFAHLRDHEGKLTEATGLYARAVKANPHEAASFNDLGLCYARRGMINDSLKSLSKAIELQPERALYRNNLAAVLVDQGRSDEALAQLRAVQSEAVANYNIGYLLLERKQNALAEASFRRAMLLDPTLVEVARHDRTIGVEFPGPAVSGQLSKIERSGRSDGGHSSFDAQTRCVRSCAGTGCLGLFATTNRNCGQFWVCGQSLCRYRPCCGRQFGGNARWRGQIDGSADAGYAEQLSASRAGCGAEIPTARAVA